MKSQHEKSGISNIEKRLRHEVKLLPSVLQDYFNDKPLVEWRAIHADDLNHLLQTLEIDLRDFCLMLLPFAAAFAETPISAFNVGAVMVDEHDDLYFGANFEFAHTNMAQTIHAEQSAISHAWMSGAGAMRLLVVNYPPCGHCRQFINETQRTDDFAIQLPERAAQSFDYYLPEAFGPDDLDVSARILGKNSDITAQDFFMHNKPFDNALLADAYEAMKFSHSPYSHSESGVGLKYEDGEIVTGSYGENAAFNPSLPPLQVALNVRRMTAKSWQTGIKQACLVERRANMSQLENARNLLQTFSKCELTYQRIDE